MSAPVLVRLLARPRTLWDVPVVGCLVLLLLLVARFSREAFAPLAGEHEFVELASGTLVFGIAAALGSLCAHRIFELETCAFAAGLPSLRRAGRGGLLVGG
ncbi:MAG: hypothetical protein JNK02_18105, partial [Planctomycetes bacterium]|nr:hypothetical protein [Planctomycetota bacterium]